MNGNEAFVKSILDTKGNCTNLDCGSCPIKKECVPTESKQTTMTRARFWLSRNASKK